MGKMINGDSYGFIEKTDKNGNTNVYPARIGKVGYQGNEKEYTIIYHRKGDKMETTRHYSDDDHDRGYYSSKVAERNARNSKERKEHEDAVNRNMRRHPERWDGDKPVDLKKSVKPKSESTIFDNVEIV